MTARAAGYAAALVLVATGCGGSGHAVPSAHDALERARSQVSFTMRWPDRAIRSARRPHFVSPSTLSVIIEVNPDAATPGPVTFANNPGIAGGTSTVAIDAPVGADVFVISLFDAAQTPGETVAAGTELGRVRLAQTIVANTLNTLTATVIGTVASVRIGPLPNQPNVVAQAGTPGAYELVGRAPATFTVAPLDAGGNVILQPDAPVAISLAANARSTGLLSVTPLSGTTDRFTVQALAPNGTTYPTSLVATATDANGSLATSSAIVDLASAVYVAYANGGAPAVARFDAHGTRYDLPTGAFAGLVNPVALAYDPDDREIFVADAGLGKVLAYDENGAPIAAFTAPAVAGANGVAYDSHNGNVYASGSGGVTVFAPNGGAPSGTAPPSFAAANAQGIAYVGASPNGPVNRIVVGNTSATPKLAFFTENGGAAGSQPLAAAPMAIAYAPPIGPGSSPQTTAQIFVTSATGVAAFDPFGASVSTAADAGAPFGITLDLNRGTPLVTERSANSVTTYLDDLSAIDGTRSFATPASLGFTQPQGVCDVF
ncbi:MAG: SMP-30/Gluconolactonase/LRE-like region [Candidatus Eremiobacteraeota bacterium]|nr:SMP-30/Gluconolactonase/LRE-like region [Candidatus Eremiobacteraeota bacterium]